MSPVVERIESAGPDRRARRLVFSGCEEPRTTAASVLKVLHVEPGDEVDLLQLEAELAEHEPVCARERALRILGYRERSVAELSKRLSDDGYPQQVVQAVVARMSELGLVDDARFAAAWSRARVSAGFGPDRVSRELSDKGIGEELASEALSAALGDTDPIERARAMLGTARLDTRADRDRALRRLVRKGFDLGTAIKAVEGERE